MDLELSRKTALVTGASSGLGNAVARALAVEGVRLAVTARRAQALRDLAAELEAKGAKPVTVIGADMADASDVSRLAAEAVRTLDQVDILANCAGGSRPTSVESGDSFWDEAYILNFSSIRRLTHLLLPDMQRRGWGRVINISGSMEPRGLNAASAAKGALHLWAKGLAPLVAKDGITVNTIRPGRIWSDQIHERLQPDERERQAFIAANIPIGRFGEPDELSGLAAFLASPRASYVTGTSIPVDGGMQRAPF